MALITNIKEIITCTYVVMQAFTTTLALKAWEAANVGKSLEDAPVVKMCASRPPITKMDSALNNLKNCEYDQSCQYFYVSGINITLWSQCINVKCYSCRQLSLSTNSIDRIVPLGGMKKLRILSLGRNIIKKIEKLEEVADTLEELWISYNLVSYLR